MMQRYMRAATEAAIASLTEAERHSRTNVHYANGYRRSSFEHYMRTIGRMLEHYPELAGEAAEGLRKVADTSRALADATTQEILGREGK